VNGAEKRGRGKWGPVHFRQIKIAGNRDLESEGHHFKWARWWKCQESVNDYWERRIEVSCFERVTAAKNGCVDTELLKTGHGSEIEGIGRITSAYRNFTMS